MVTTCHGYLGFMVVDSGGYHMSLLFDSWLLTQVVTTCPGYLGFMVLDSVLHLSSL